MLSDNLQYVETKHQMLMLAFLSFSSFFFKHRLCFTNNSSYSDDTYFLSLQQNKTTRSFGLV